MDFLYATFCSVNSDGTLDPLGDPHVHKLQNAAWVFDGTAIVHPSVTLMGIPVGIWHVVMALGHAPYRHECGAITLGDFNFAAAGSIVVIPRIYITYEPGATIRMPRPELPPGKQELPAARRSLGQRIKELGR